MSEIETCKYCGSKMEADILYTCSKCGCGAENKTWVLVPRDDWNYIIDCLEVETLDYPYKQKCKEIIKKLGGGET